MHATIMPDLGACTEVEGTIGVYLALEHVTRLDAGVKLGSTMTVLVSLCISVSTLSPSPALFGSKSFFFCTSDSRGDKGEKNVRTPPGHRPLSGLTLS